jgi:hypothetical protein
MRIIVTILFFCLPSAIVCGQVIKPNSNPPVPVVGSAPPPPPPGGTGLLLLKIPVTGSYYLGMDRKEYDSIMRLPALTLKTDQAVFPLKTEPGFLGKRLAYLYLTVDSIFFSTDGTDISSLYETKLGPPDEKQVLDTLMQFPSVYDLTLNGQYRLKAMQLTWHFKQHDIVISSSLADLRNGTWQGYYSIHYKGNELFRNILREMAYREDY